MASCKECAHVEICEDITRHKLSPSRAEEILPILRERGKTCEHFKDRSQFVKLPCKVGEAMGIKEIKPCPFCGEKADYKDIGYLFKKTHVYVVSCPTCGCSTPYCEDIITAVEIWNKRSCVAALADKQSVSDGKEDMSLTTALIILDRLNTTERIDVDREKIAEAVRVVSAAAKYRIPQKPVKVENYCDVRHPKLGKCPTCETVYIHGTEKFCGNCGQALDWGEKQ